MRILCIVMSCERQLTSRDCCSDGAVEEESWSGFLSGVVDVMTFG